MRKTCAFWLFGLLAAAVAPPPVHAQKSADGENRVVEIVNERASDMVRLYASRITTEDWEENILTKQPIRARTKMRVNFDDGTGECVFDFRAVFRDEVVVHYFGINVCAESYWRITDDED
jgi:hypothetical protein